MPKRTFVQNLTLLLGMAFIDGIVWSVVRAARIGFAGVILWFVLWIWPNPDPRPSPALAEATITDLIGAFMVTVVMGGFLLYALLDPWKGGDQ